LNINKKYIIFSNINKIKKELKERKMIREKNNTIKMSFVNINQNPTNDEVKWVIEINEDRKEREYLLEGYFIDFEIVDYVFTNPESQDEELRVDYKKYNKLSIEWIFNSAYSKKIWDEINILNSKILNGVKTIIDEDIFESEFKRISSEFFKLEKRNLTEQYEVVGQ
jgi:hypothetical protein